MYSNDSLLLKYIYDEAYYLYSTSKEISFEDFSINPTFKRAFSRSIEIIGEASKKLTPSFKTKYNQLNWKAIAGMRDKLIHDYFGVDYDIVWDVATHKSLEIIEFCQLLNQTEQQTDTLFE